MTDDADNVARIIRVRCNAVEACCIRVDDQASVLSARKGNAAALPFDAVRASVGGPT